MSATMFSSCWGPVILTSPTLRPRRLTFSRCSSAGSRPTGKLNTTKRAALLTVATLPTTALSGVTITLGSDAGGGFCSCGGAGGFCSGGGAGGGGGAASPGRGANAVGGACATMAGAGALAALDCPFFFQIQPEAASPLRRTV